MNRIVKLIDYKPNGYQTSILSFEATANENLLPDLYTIKRYSYFTINGLYYSFTGDISFNKLTEGDEFLQSLSDNNILHQGQYFELPVQNAIGENFETATIVVKDNITGEPVFIDGNSINVYIRDTNTGKYNFYNETNNIFLLGPESLSYEKRINENGFYEIKFGNGIFGKRLNEGDEILIYYLKSDGESGVVSPNQLNGNNLNFFTTPQFEAISNDIYVTQNITFLTPQNAQNIAFSNQNSSTNPKEKETVDEIRINSKKSFQSQNRLVTIEDYETFITRNFSNIIQSLNVVNNKSYINEYIKYFYDLGLDRPNDDPRFLFNQLKFSSSGESNNVYLFAVPAIKNVNENNEVNFLSTSQKNSIVNAIETQKMVNIEIVPQDPVYTGFNLGLSLPNEKLNLDIINDTFLVVKRDVSVRNSAESIKQQVNNIFINFFDNLKIGDLVSISNIINEILTVQGVTEVITRRVTNDITLQSPNLSLLVFNSSYPEIDINTISSDIQLPFFKFPFLYNKSILNNIIVEDA